MARIKIKTVFEGPGPAEAIVAISRTDGREEEVVVPKDMIQNGTIEVGRVSTTEGSGPVLVELPTESASGNWRLWVDSATLT